MNRSIHFYIAHIWFLINAFACLYPPLYWEVSNYSELIFGFPASFIYFMSTALSVTLSVLYSFWYETLAGEFQS
jgi:hypothetical protein